MWVCVGKSLHTSSRTFAFTFVCASVHVFSYLLKQIFVNPESSFSLCGPTASVILHDRGGSRDRPDAVPDFTSTPAAKDVPLHHSQRSVCFIHEIKY